ncbi:glycosyltransferase [Pseudomonas sp. RtIB026]|uniref:glycosyltransferase n=1 Tax=Pseudomonas sp. RtIB026 TaxID=2749999 RepID=UPI001940B624|nr:glycosyltransferase [Pseudomonas sp. RtIB026]
MQSRKKICIVATVPVVLHVFMRAHIKRLSANYDVTLVVPGARHEVEELLGAHVDFIPYAIERKISLKRDVISLYRLWRILMQRRYDCVLSLMPKSGLVAMLAGWLSATRCRVHIFTGQVWFTRRGLGRRFLMFLDRLLAGAATHLLTDSHSQRDFLVESKIVARDKIRVLGKGSISGVDIERFKPDPQRAAQMRSEMNIAENAKVFLFLGRVNTAKGILDLAQAFASLGEGYADAHLLVVGPDDEGIDESLAAILQPCQDRFHRVGFTRTPEHYMAMADVFCMPSYREGFGLAVIEAAAVGVPSMVSRIYGLTDAVEEDVTGLFHEAGDIAQIREVLTRLHGDSVLRDRLALSGLQRARRDFSQDLVVGEMQVFIKAIMDRQ